MNCQRNWDLIKTMVTKILECQYWNNKKPWLDIFYSKSRIRWKNTHKDLQMCFYFEFVLLVLTIHRCSQPCRTQLFGSKKSKHNGIPSASEWMMTQKNTLKKFFLIIAALKFKGVKDTGSASFKVKCMCARLLIYSPVTSVTVTHF